MQICMQVKMTHHFNSSISGRVSKEAKIKIANLDKQQSREQRGVHIKAQCRKSFLTMWQRARKSCLGLKERTAPRTGLLPAEQPRQRADFCNLREAAGGRWSAAVERKRQKELRFPPLLSLSPIIHSQLSQSIAGLDHSYTFLYPKIWDLQVEEGGWMPLCTPDIKHKTLLRGFYTAGAGKELGKLIPKRPQRYCEPCKAAGWSISGWRGRSRDIIVIIYYITSHIAAFSIPPQPPPAALTLSLRSYAALVFQLSSV